MKDKYNAYAGKNSWAISLDCMLGKAPLQDALQSGGNVKSYRALMNASTPSFVAAVRKALDRGIDVILMTAVQADTHEEQERHLETLLKTMGFNIHTQRLLKNSISAPPVRAAALLKAQAANPLVISGCSEFLGAYGQGAQDASLIQVVEQEQPEHIPGIRIDQEIKLPQWFLFFVMNQIPAGTAPQKQELAPQLA